MASLKPMNLKELNENVLHLYIQYGYFGTKNAKNKLWQRFRLFDTKIILLT